MDMIDVYAMENEIKEYHNNNTQKLAEEHVLRSGRRAGNVKQKFLLYALAAIALATAFAAGTQFLP